MMEYSVSLSGHSLLSSSHNSVFNETNSSCVRIPWSLRSEQETVFVILTNSPELYNSELGMFSKDDNREKVLKVLDGSLPPPVPWVPVSRILR